MMNKVILLVEDNPYDELLILSAFEDLNIKNVIVVVRDGSEALDFLFARGKFDYRQSRDVPCLILLDLKLPKLDGLQVLKEIRQNRLTHNIPVVMLSSSKASQDLVKSYSLGASAYVRKPVDFNQFVQTVKQLGMFWLALNITPQAAG